MDRHSRKNMNRRKNSFSTISLVVAGTILLLLVVAIIFIPKLMPNMRGRTEDLQNNTTDGSNDGSDTNGVNADNNQKSNYKDDADTDANIDADTDVGTNADTDSGLSGEKAPLETSIARNKQVQFEGEAFDYREDLVNILILGSDEDLESREAKEKLPRAMGNTDFIVLLSIDPEEKSILPIQFDRDTILEVKTLSVLGREAGTRTTQLARAHSFGRDRQEGAELTGWALSQFLGGVEIDQYITINMNDINDIVDYFGGVDITLQEDLTELDPTFLKGETVHIAGDMTQRFLRARMNVGDGTNVERMSRHQVFLKAFKPVLKARLDQGKDEIAKMQKDIEKFYYTDISKGRLINLAWQVKDYEFYEIFTLDGKHGNNAQDQVEFVVSSDTVKGFVLDKFVESK